MKLFSSDMFAWLQAISASIYEQAGKMQPATRTHYAAARGAQGAYRRKGPGRWHQGQQEPAGSKLARKAWAGKL
jgi:hypothetical protein